MKSRKKKRKLKVKNLLKLILFILLTIFLILYFKDKYKDSKLEELDYSNREIDIITEKINREDINKIDKYYENLDEYSSVSYFHIENIDRYDKLKEKTNYDIEDIIMRVNTSIDKPFYTDIKTVSNSSDLLVLVNKYYKFSDDYVPDDLIKVENTQMREEAGTAILKMVEDMREEGLTVNLLSGYRSYKVQQSLYDKYVDEDGKEEADTYSARAGHSEHQSGLAMDLSDNWNLYEEFENTDEFAWLSEHAHEYGYILRYTKDKVYMTGYVYEPWHYRYVGTKVATIIHEENLTFEEYCVLYRGLY